MQRVRTPVPVSYRPSKSQNKIWGTMKTETQRYDLNRCNVRNNEVTTSKGKKCKDATYSSESVHITFLTVGGSVKRVFRTFHWPIRRYIVSSFFCTPLWRIFPKTIFLFQITPAHINNSWPYFLYRLGIAP